MQHTMGQLKLRLFSTQFSSLNVLCSGNVTGTLKGSISRHRSWGGGAMCVSV